MQTLGVKRSAIRSETQEIPPERWSYCTNGAINSLFKLKWFQSGSWIHFLHIFLKIKPRPWRIFINLFCLYKKWNKKDTTACRKLRFESHNSVLKTSAHSTPTHSHLCEIVPLFFVLLSLLISPPGFPFLQETEAGERAGWNAVEDSVGGPSVWEPQ